MKELARCEESEQMSLLMSLALDGMLDPDDEQRLESHLAGCVLCQSEWHAMREVSALFANSPLVGPPLGFAVRVERRLAQKSKQRQQLFGGMAVLTSSLSLAGVTVAAVVLIILGLTAWHWLGALPAVQQGTSIAAQIVSGMGLMGKGANLFLWDLLLRYGPPLVLLLGAGLALLAGVWIWLLVKRPGGSHRNGYV